MPQGENKHKLESMYKEMLEKCLRENDINAKSWRFKGRTVEDLTNQKSSLFASIPYLNRFSWFEQCKKKYHNKFHAHKKN